MKKDAMAWTAHMEALLAGESAESEDYERHLTHIGWLQHERLVHLLVLMLTAVGTMITFLLAMIEGGWLYILLFLLLMLTGFYVVHYFFLENTVQRWYRMADALHDKVLQA